jgi:hypothetical protein
MLVLAVLEFGLELGLLSFPSPLPFALRNSSGSSQNSPQSGRASSLVGNLAAQRRPGSSSK